MAHNISIVKGKAAIAFVGETPWHGLGQALTPGASIETWVKESGLDYDIISTPVKYEIPMVGDKSTLRNIEGIGSITQNFNAKKVLYRGDTQSPLSVVSSAYNVVQPREVLEFFRDLVEGVDANMHLETAGSLFGGTRYWAMANTNHEADVIKNDRICSRLLLTTSCDGTLATTAKFVSVRVVCNNTLRIALDSSAEGAAHVRVTHGSVFNPEKIKESLGLLDSGWESFLKNIKSMAKTKVTDDAAKDFIARIMLNDEEKYEDWKKNMDSVHKRVGDKLDTIFNMYKGEGMGADIVTGTVWGALNAITEYADHRIGQKNDNKLWNSWFGFSEGLKNKAFAQALEMV